MPTTFRVTATPRARFQLARLLLRNDLKLQGRSQQKAIDRARRDLGLYEITEQLLERGRVAQTLVLDRTPAVFTVTEDVAEFVVNTVSGMDKDPGLSTYYIEPLLQQLEAKKDADGLEGVAAFDEAAEAPKWKASLAPVITNPEQLAEGLKAAFEHGESWMAARLAAIAVLDRILTPPTKEEL